MDLNELLSNRTIQITIGLAIFFIYRHCKSKKNANEKSETKEAPKNDHKVAVTEDIDSNDVDWIDDCPSVEESALNDEFSESVKQESEAYGTESLEDGAYKNGVDI